MSRRAGQIIDDIYFAGIYEGAVVKVERRREEGGILIRNGVMTRDGPATTAGTKHRAMADSVQAGVTDMGIGLGGQMTTRIGLGRSCSAIQARREARDVVSQKKKYME